VGRLDRASAGHHAEAVVVLMSKKAMGILCAIAVAGSLVTSVQIANHRDEPVRVVGSDGISAALQPFLDDMEPCAEEDSDGPCYWDAQERGNGIGHSFYVTDEQVLVYVN
jgi:hypothetical protein